jgi:hypothetical protein
MIFDGPVKSLEMLFSVIPAKAGIQSSQIGINSLDSGFHRSDDFLRVHHHFTEEKRASMKAVVELSPSPGGRARGGGTHRSDQVHSRCIITAWGL